MNEIENTLKSVIAEIEQASDADNGLPHMALSTGYIDLDKYTHGIKPGKLYAFAGAPASGKSSLLINLANNMMRESTVNVVFLSHIFSQTELLARMLSACSRLDFLSLMCGQLLDAQWAQLQSHIGRFRSAQNLFLSSNQQVEKDFGCLKSLILNIQSKNSANKTVVFLDDVFLFSLFSDIPKKKCLRYLRSLAIEMNISIIVTLSVNTVSLSYKRDQRPQLVDLRFHQSIEDNVDTIVTLNRDVSDPQLALLSKAIELMVLKNNNGPTGIVKLHFDRSSLAIDNYTGL